MSKKYFLWGFLIGDHIVITRGETREQAQIWATRNINDNVTIGILDYLPIHAAILYTINHEFDWLNTAPLWVKRQEEKERRKEVNSKLPEEKRKSLIFAFNKVIDSLNQDKNLNLSKIA